MSSEIAIKIEDISKCYHIYEKPRDRLMQMLMGGRKQYYREFWAVRSVSFEIRKGETVGIVGRNGSGKSTLLQMICGTLNPSGGSIRTNGRVAALLELGSGFNPEFTGRENVYLNAAVLGLSHEETNARFDEILAFADIGDFVDQPVKTYSSGMLVRLAFAVAVNVDPQILIVDEALSVGDELFQRKCFSRIEEIKNSGATILFVSHSGAAIIELCDRSILLDEGELLLAGVPKTVVSQYQKLLYASAEQRSKVRANIKSSLRMTTKIDGESLSIDSSKDLVDEGGAEFFDPNLKPTTTLAYESLGAQIISPGIFNMQGKAANCLVAGRKYKYIYTVDFDRSVSNVRFGMVIRTTSGFSLGGALSASIADSIPFVEAGRTVSVEFVFDCLLTPGVYFLNAGVFGAAGQEETVLHRLVDAVAIRVLSTGQLLATELINFNCIPDVQIHE